jgi:hypothetical protein
MLNSVSDFLVNLRARPCKHRFAANGRSKRRVVVSHVTHQQVSDKDIISCSSPRLADAARAPSSPRPRRSSSGRSSACRGGTGGGQGQPPPPAPGRMRLARRSSRSRPPGTLEHWPLARLAHSQRAAVNPRRPITAAWSRSPPYPPTGFRTASTPAGRAKRERRSRRRTARPARRGRVRPGAGILCTTRSAARPPPRRPRVSSVGRAPISPNVAFWRRRSAAARNASVAVVALEPAPVGGWRG